MNKPIVGLDVDDVVAVPHTMQALLDGLDVPHKERKDMEDMKARYKRGELAAVDVHKHRHGILSNYAVEKRLDAIKSVVNALPQENRRADRDAEAITLYVGSVEASLSPEDTAKRLGTWFKFRANSGTGASAQTPMDNYLDRVESALQQ